MSRCHNTWITVGWVHGAGLLLQITRRGWLRKTPRRATTRSWRSLRPCRGSGCRRGRHAVWMGGAEIGEHLARTVWLSLRRRIGAPAAQTITVQIQEDGITSAMAPCRAGASSRATPRDPYNHIQEPYVPVSSNRNPQHRSSGHLAQAGVYPRPRYRPEFILGPRSADPWAGMTEHVAWMNLMIRILAHDTPAKSGGCTMRAGYRNRPYRERTALCRVISRVKPR